LFQLSRTADRAFLGRGKGGEKEVPEGRYSKSVSHCGSSQEIASAGREDVKEGISKNVLGSALMKEFGGDIEEKRRREKSRTDKKSKF